MLMVMQAAGQMGMPGMGMGMGGDKPKAAAVKSDIPFIRCQACEAMMKQAHRHTKSTRENLKPGQKVGVEAVPAHVGAVCCRVRCRLEGLVRANCHPAGTS